MNKRQQNHLIPSHVILVVDDEPNNRLLLKAYLASENYHVKPAKTGEEAIAIVSETPPDAIILDVMLPNMSGYEVCRWLKKSEKTRYIPVIMATALRGNDERIRGVEAGADDFITKPYNRFELTTRIRSLLRISKLHKELEQKIAELEQTKHSLQKMAVTDELTQLYNYRAFRHQLHLEISRSKRFKMPLSVLMMDIDYFKLYNDRFGHPAGDQLLTQFARILNSNIREVDFLARYGGEEFVLLLPGTDKKSGKIVAEKLRKQIENASFPYASGMPEKAVTMSVGISTYPDDTSNEERLVNLADNALYQAKNNGRNRSVALSGESVHSYK